MQQLRYLVVPVALGIVAGGCGDSSPSEHIGKSGAYLTGINVLEVSGSPALPEAAVGFLGFGSGNCAGTVILNQGTHGNGIVLTAAHCFCPNVLSSTSGVLFLSRRGSGVSVGSAQITSALSDICKARVNADDAVTDLAIIELSAPLSRAAFPRLPRVYTGGDFRDRLFNNPSLPTFFNPPVLFTATGRQAAPLTLLQGTVTATVELNQDCGFLGLGHCTPYWIALDRGDGPLGEEGDSGGPLTFQGADGVPVIFGVYSNTTPGLFTDQDRFSPTWDNGNPNGAFIRQFYVDADEDGVDDSFDNAPPSACPDDPFRCANPDQADRDEDGVGDVIDNCAPSVCERRGVDKLACANAAQFDADQDGTGDACDSCAVTPNGRAAVGGDASRGDASQYADADGDGVGDACDDCHDVPNPFQACIPTPGCDDRTAACASVDCASGACVGFPFLGKCSVSGATCGNDAACPLKTPETHETCIVGFGRCTLQNDDPDHDGLGNACENCPFDADTRVRANSNIDAEQAAQKRRVGVASLGDHCDPVPQLVSRAIVGTKSLSGPPVTTDARASTGSYTTFFGTAGLGIGATSPTFTEKAGFRRCDCILVGIGGTKSILDSGKCMATLCGIASDSYPANINYTPISTATSLNVTRLPTTPSGQPMAVTLGEEFFRTFTNDVQCDDTFASLRGRSRRARTRNGSEEVLRVLAWRIHGLAIAREVAVAYFLSMGHPEE